MVGENFYKRDWRSITHVVNVTSITSVFSGNAETCHHWAFAVVFGFLGSYNCRSNKT